MKEHGKSVALAVLGVILVGMTIAYAALQTSLRINGTVESPAVSWDVHITGWQENTSARVGNPVITAPTITATSIADLGVALNKPGDSVTFNFNIVNTGSIDAKLNNYTPSFTCDTGKDCSKISYSLTCTNNATTADSVLAANTGTSACTLTFTRAEATASGTGSTYSDSEGVMTFSADWTYVQN